jgi:hypothetical protein
MSGAHALCSRSQMRAPTIRDDDVGRAFASLKLEPSPRPGCGTRTRLAHPCASPDIIALTTRPVVSCCAARSEYMTCRTSPDVSEDAEPFHHRPVPRPQAAAFFFARCAARSLSRSTRSSQRGAVVRVEARSGQQRPPRLPQQPPRGGSVATGAGAERRQLAAGRSDVVAVRACRDQTACV